MIFSDTIKAVINEETANHRGDSAEAHGAAMKRLRRMKEARELVESEGWNLLSGAVRAHIEANRHRASEQIRGVGNGNGNGERARAKREPAEPLDVVGSAVSQAINQWKRWHLLPVAGTCLGELKGRQLPEVLANLEKQAQGISDKAWVIRQLIGLVPAEKLVREAVSEKKIEAIWQEMMEARRERVA